MGFGVQVVQFPETDFVAGLITDKQYLNYYCFPVKNPVVAHHDGIVWTYNSAKRLPWDKRDRDYRNTPMYRDWRLAVFTRDDFTCQKCQQHGGKLEAHHIKKFHNFHDLRFEISNGLTLCRCCHLNEHKGGVDAKEN